MLCDPSLLQGDISEISGDVGDYAHWMECTTGGIVYRFESDIVRQKWWCVVTDPRAYGESAEDSAEEDNLSEYEYESQPESPEDSGASCTESESDGALSELESRPLDHDALLDMFRRGLEGDYMLSSDDEHSDGSSFN